MPHPESTATAAASRSWRAAVVLLSLAATAQAQHSQRKAAAFTATNTTVYTLVEEMPKLPDGGGQAAMVALIQKRIHIPLLCDGYPVNTRMVFAFTVTQTGAVANIRIIQSIDCRVDTAVVQAVRALPRFIPARHHGVPVRVKFTFPISFHWQ